jgi:hypothetical protein
MEYMADYETGRRERGTYQIVEGEIETSHFSKTNTLSLQRSTRRTNQPRRLG